MDFFFSILNVLDVNNTLVFYANSFFEVLSMFAFDRSVPRNKRIWNSNPKWPMLERNMRYVTDYLYIFVGLCLFVCVWETWYYLITTMQLFTPLKKILIWERFEVVSSSFFWLLMHLTNYQILKLTSFLLQSNFTWNDDFHFKYIWLIFVLIHSFCQLTWFNNDRVCLV